MSLFGIQLARKGRSIQIQNRSLASGFDSKEIETFSTVTGGIVTAIICTPRGKTVFDGVNAEEDVTHEFHLKYPGFEVNVENWILYPDKNKRFRILDVKNCCEGDERLVIQCTERGVTDRGASSA